jgi:type III pantothenate kinase
MKPDVVVDVGNTAMKWGRCTDAAVVDIARLSADDEATWREQSGRWGLSQTAVWVVAGVAPRRRDAFVEYLQRRGEIVHVLRSPSDLPLVVRLEKPEHVGLDRLLDAVALNSRRPPGQSGVVVDVGSAITVDLIGSDGAFVGGAILPGLRLMTRALHDYTALLPLVDPPSGPPDVPGRQTRAAIELGIFSAAAGGVRLLIERYRESVGSPPLVVLTGGDAAALLPALDPGVEHWPTMTLEGIRFTAEAMP